MLTSTDIPFYACQAFLCLPEDGFVQIMPISVGKNEIDLSWKDLFFESSLSSLKIYSHQKDRCDLLDLPVLFYRSYYESGNNWNKSS